MADGIATTRHLASGWIRRTIEIRSDAATAVRGSERKLLGKLPGIPPGN